MQEAGRLKSRIISVLTEQNLDINKRIDLGEFTQMIRLYFSNTTKERSKQMFIAFDEDNEGYIIFNELLTAFNCPKLLKFC